MPDALDVVAVVPTFAPPESTSELLRTLSFQVSRVVVSDDASPCTSDPQLIAWSALPNVDVIRHDRNCGIARGLNDGLRIARDLGCNWLLTVDQDTMLPAGYVDAVSEHIRMRSKADEVIGAVGAEVVVDASGEMRYPLRDSDFGPITEEVIQTGTLWNVSALTKVGGFDEELRIDAVDAAACLALRQHGFVVSVAPDTWVEHSLGSARTVKLAGRSIMVTGHSPQRRTSMLRNRLRLFPAEFAQSPRHAVRTLRRVLVNQTLGLILEEDRWRKAQGSVRGITRPSKDNLRP